MEIKGGSALLELSEWLAGDQNWQANTCKALEAQPFRSRLSKQGQMGSGSSMETLEALDPSSKHNNGFLATQQ